MAARPNFTSPYVSVPGLGCVKTRARKEGAELYSLLSFPNSVRQCCYFSNRQNRDELSIRKFNFGVFIQPRPLASLRCAEQ
jgi:hypothetical protein